MSGGAFDYRQHTLTDLAEQIRDRIRYEPQTNEYGETHEPMPEQIAAAFERAALLCEIAGRAVHDVDYLLSGDSGDDSFYHSSLEWTADQVANLLSGKVTFADIAANEQAARRVAALTHQWTKDRWDYENKRQRVRGDDGVTEDDATFWGCADEVKGIMWFHDAPNLDDIKPLRENLAELRRLAHRWLNDPDPVRVEAAKALTEAMNS